MRVMHIGAMYMSVSLEAVGSEFQINGHNDNNQWTSGQNVRIGGRFAIEITRFGIKYALTLFVPRGVSESATSTGKRIGYNKGDGSSELGSFKELEPRKTTRNGYARITVK